MVRRDVEHITELLRQNQTFRFFLWLRRLQRRKRRRDACTTSCAVRTTFRAWQSCLKG